MLLSLSLRILKIYMDVVMDRLVYEGNGAMVGVQAEPEAV